MFGAVPLHVCDNMNDLMQQESNHSDAHSDDTHHYPSIPVQPAAGTLTVWIRSWHHHPSNGAVNGSNVTQALSRVRCIKFIGAGPDLIGPVTQTNCRGLRLAVLTLSVRRGRSETQCSRCFEPTTQKSLRRGFRRVGAFHLMPYTTRASVGH